MKWLYAVAHSIRGNALAGSLRAESRDDAMRIAWEGAKKIGEFEPDMRTSVVQIPWPVVLDAIAENLPDTPETFRLLELLGDMLPKSSEPPGSSL